VLVCVCERERLQGFGCLREIERGEVAGSERESVCVCVFMRVAPAGLRSRVQGSRDCVCLSV